MTNSTLLNPKLLGFWVKLMREGTHLSQEALAEAAGLVVRTVQRVEAGEGSNIQTRRALARGLGYENCDIFDDPAFAANLTKILEDLDGISKEAVAKQFPDHIRLAVERIRSGSDLGRIGALSEGILLHMHDQVDAPAKILVAELFDYLQDVQDVADVSSHVQKLGYDQEMGSMLKAIEDAGLVGYWANAPCRLKWESTPFR